MKRSMRRSSRVIRMAIDGGYKENRLIRQRPAAVEDRAVPAIGKAICSGAEQQLYRDLHRASYALCDVGQVAGKDNPDGSLRAHQAGEEATKGAL